MHDLTFVSLPTHPPIQCHDAILQYFVAILQYNYDAISPQLNVNNQKDTL